MKCLMLFLAFLVSDLKRLKVEGFELEWSHTDDQIAFSLKAPTEGWVAIGFTEGSNIVDTNLIQGRVKNGSIVIEDQFVTGFGKHPTVESLGVPSRISNLRGEEYNGVTTISFSIKQKKLDELHYDLSEGKEINVWLAYSVSDDFDHHSRKRILRKITL